MACADKAKGWLGLLMGTRVYYRFYDAENEDQAVFDTRIDQVVREIGDRGKPSKRTAAAVSEGVPPLVPAPAPAPAPRAQPSPRPARAPAPAPEPAPEPAPSPPTPRTALAPSARSADRSFSPSMQLAPSTEQPGGGMVVEMSTVVDRMEALEARVKGLTPAPPKELVSAEQLAALETRLDAMHEARLLSDDELFALEDICADYLELKTSTAGVLTQELACANPRGAAAWAKLAKMVVLSEGTASDPRCARQLRRKFV